MKIYTLLFLMMFAGVSATPILRAQELDGSDLNKEMQERDARVNKLSIDEQLKLRAAQTKAADDPAVKAAYDKRNEAIREFRAAIRAAMIKADPTVAPLLDKIAVPASQVP